MSPSGSNPGTPVDDTGVGLVEVSAPDLVAVLEGMESEPAVTDLELPFDIVEGAASWTVTAPRDRLSALGDQLDAFGIEFTVDRIHQQITSEQLLTDRQRRVIETAIEAGYYTIGQKD